MLERLKALFRRKATTPDAKVLVATPCPRPYLELHLGRVPRVPSVDEFIAEHGQPGLDEMRERLRRAPVQFVMAEETPEDRARTQRARDMATDLQAEMQACAEREAEINAAPVGQPVNPRWQAMLDRATENERLRHAALSQHEQGASQ